MVLFKRLVFIPLSLCEGVTFLLCTPAHHRDRMDLHRRCTSPRGATGTRMVRASINRSSSRARTAVHVVGQASNFGDCQLCCTWHIDRFRACPIFFRPHVPLMLRFQETHSFSAVSFSCGLVYAWAQLARGTVCLPRTLPWKASFSSASLLQASNAPARSSQSGILRVDPSEKLVSGCHVTFPWNPRVVSFLSTAVHDLGTRPRIPKQANYFCCSSAFLHHFSVALKIPLVGLQGLANLCVTLSPQSRNLLPGIFGRGRRIVHLQLSILLQATDHQPPQLS